MTAPLFRVPPGTLAGSEVGALVRVDGAEGHHATTVTRLRPGEGVLLADGSGLLGEGRVEGTSRGELTVRLRALRDARPSPPRLVLAQALVKDGRDERAVEAATELGVDEVIPWQARRCVVQWRGDRGEKSRAKWAAVTRSAAQQARRARTPDVAAPHDTWALARRLRDSGHAGGVALVLHEEANTPLAGPVAEGLAGRGEVLLVVGPEGGVDPQELDLLTEAGGVPVRLGAEVLRAGTAGPAALAAVLAATRWRARPGTVD